MKISNKINDLLVFAAILMALILAMKIGKNSAVNSLQASPYYDYCVEISGTENKQCYAFANEMKEIAVKMVKETSLWK